MPLVTMKELLKESVEKNYAVGAFVTLEHSFSEAIIQAAEEKGVPVILMVPDIGPGFWDLHDLFLYLVPRLHRSKVPIALHLDHGASFEVVIQAIHYGFSSVMIDGSALPLEENIALTKKVVEVAHTSDITVEAELGHVAGGEGSLDGGSLVDESVYTKPEDAQRFISETGVDALAVAFGTVHGLFKEKPRLDLKRLKTIRDCVEIPLVMHGGSGLTEQDYRDVVQSGVNKINYFTDLSQAAVKTVKDLIEEKEGKLHYPDLVFAGTRKAVEVIKAQIELFGTLPLSDS
jgi:fructose-bisphosphate aldolase, class II